MFFSSVDPNHSVKLATVDSSRFESGNFRGPSERPDQSESVIPHMSVTSQVHTDEYKISSSQANERPRSPESRPDFQTMLVNPVQPPKPSRDPPMTVHAMLPNPSWHPTDRPRGTVLQAQTELPPEHTANWERLTSLARVNPCRPGTDPLCQLSLAPSAGFVPAPIAAFIPPARGFLSPAPPSEARTR